MKPSEKKCMTCNNCSAALPLFNLFHCSVLNQRKSATETCANWRTVVEILEPTDSIELVCAKCYDKTCSCCQSCNQASQYCICHQPNVFGINLQSP